MNPVPAPVSGGVRIGLYKDSETFEGPYLELVDVILYLANTVWPNISIAVVILVRVCAEPKSSHLVYSKRAIRYLKETKENVILYRAHTGTDLLEYVDSYFAADHVVRKSTTVYLFQMKAGAVSWRSKKQTILFLSTSEA